MTAPLKPLADDDARRAAIVVHDRSILVEAGAGSGKTAIMAGRIAVVLAEGIVPKSIAAGAVTQIAARRFLFPRRQFVGGSPARPIPPRPALCRPPPPPCPPQN